MSPLVGLLVLAPLTLGSVVSDPANTVLTPLVMLRVAISAGLASWLVFSALGLLIRLIVRQPSVARGILFLISYVLIEAARTSIVAVAAAQINTGFFINWPYRIVGGGLTGMVLFTLVALVFNDSRRYRDTARRLLDSQETLRQNLALTEREFALRRDESLSGVRTIVENALREVSIKSGDSREAVQQTVSELVRISDTVIRPLSHELFEMPPTFLEESAQKPRVRFRRAVALATIANPFRPEVYAVLVTLLLIGVTLFGPAGLWVGLAQLTVILVSGYLVFAAARAWIQPKLSALSLGIRFVILYLVYFMYSFFLGLGVAIAFTPSHSPLTVAYVVLIGIPVFSFLAFTPGLERARLEALDELAQVNDELIWLNARLGARLWSERKVIAKSLHRDVQGVLVAAAFRLERAINQGNSTADALAEVRELVELATRFVVQPPVAPLVSTLIDELRTQWQGVVTLDFSIPDDVADALNADLVARQAFFDLMAEFVMNSVKHGQANHISGSLDLHREERILALALFNDGVPLEADSPVAGLGLKLIETVAISQKLADSPTGGVVLTVELPVEMPASAAY